MKQEAPTFLVLCHSDPAAFQRLAGRLASVGNIIVHVDAKTAPEPFRHPASVQTDRRIDVKWAGFSMITATLELVRKALSLHPDSSHYVLLSGADYPICSNEEIAAFFRRSRDHNSIRLFDMRTSREHFWRHLQMYYLADLFGARGRPKIEFALRRGVELLIPVKKRWPAHLIPAAGSQWWALTPECCRDLLAMIERDEFWTRFWKWSFAPDELYFHSLVANSPHAARSDGFVASPYHKDTASIHHLCDPSLRKTYTIDDFSEIVSSGKLFVRKIDSRQSGSLLDALDAHAAKRASAANAQKAADTRSTTLPTVGC